MINVVAGILFHKGKVLIAKRSQEKHLGGHWEFPGGKINTNESAKEALKREFQEELGIKINVLTKFLQITHRYSDKSISLDSFIVEKTSGVIKNKEHEEIKWVNIENLDEFHFAPADIPIVKKLQLENKRQFNRAYYSSTIQKLLNTSNDSILGHLLRRHTNQKLTAQQKNAWIVQIRVLKDSLQSFSGKVYFEFAIPRMGKKVDNIVIIQNKIFVIEFKVGESKFQKYAEDQVIDYCLDLQNFHEGSHDAPLIPVLVSTNASFENYDINNVYALNEAVKTGANSLGSRIKNFLDGEYSAIDTEKWEHSIYKPTPTIVEAAQALYKGHNVNEISRSDSGAINLSKTSECISDIIDKSKLSKIKSICFVTGVPGAGKTLAGLNIANERNKVDEKEHSVFLSGNGPLVKVLREALAIDQYNSRKEIGEKITKKEARRNTSAFIQNIHHFRDEYLRGDNAPIEKVVVFDEAQRAWTMHQTNSFMKRKKGIEDFNMSEPEFLIDVMDRHEDWCTIICLIGGGQEINTGEAGLEEWILALKEHYPNWEIHYSNVIVENENYLKQNELIEWLKINANSQLHLHLSTSVRSFRSEKISELIESILSINQVKAKEIYNSIENKYPIRITRDIKKARNWLRSVQKGTERIGIIASSGARRLKSQGLDVKNNIDPANWILKYKNDVRSSNFLENVATEFEIQGLEIDFTCLAWGANFFLKDSHWKYKRFSGTKWQTIRKEIDKEYLLNTYRVLLTRARQGMVIYMPEGDKNDITRKPEYYDETFRFLQSIGLEEL